MRDRIRKRLLLALVGLAALSLAAPCWADDDEEEEPGLYEETGLYATAMATYAIPTEKGKLRDATNGRLNAIYGPTSYSDVDNVWGVNGRVGYRLHKRVAVETQFEWLPHLQINSQVGNVGAEQKTDITLFALTGNAKGYLLTGRFQPYGVVGAGWGRSRTNFPGGGAKRHEDGFIYRFGGGFDLYASPDVALTTEISYVGPTGSMDDLNYVSIAAGFTLRFYALD